MSVQDDKEGYSASACRPLLRTVANLTAAAAEPVEPGQSVGVPRRASRSTSSSLGDTGSGSGPVGAATHVLVGGLVGLAVFVAVIAVTAWEAALLAAWDAVAVVVVGWVLLLIRNKDAAATAALATREDDSRAGVDLLLVSASVMSLVGVGLGLVKASAIGGGAEAAIVTLAVLTVILSWALVHVVFTLRYARIYHAESGGVDFGDAPPDYRDFAYLAFTVGMTYQVSDTQLTTRTMRRTVSRHALLSYLFGTVVVAVTINVVAGLLR